MPTQNIITNVISIGTADNPVNKIFANYIIGCKNITYDSPVYSEGPEAETLTGIEVDTVTNAVTSKSNHTCSGTLTVTGAAQVNNTLGVTGTATMAAITASGLITANGGLTLGANMTTGSYWVRGSGANVGMKFTGENVEFSGTMKIGGLVDINANVDIGANWLSGSGGNEGLKFTGANANFSNNLVVDGDMIVTAATGDYYHSTNQGKTGTITLASITQIFVSGGIVYNWS